MTCLLCCAALFLSETSHLASAPGSLTFAFSTFNLHLSASFPDICS